jgi:hypothetical protein
LKLRIWATGSIYLTVVRHLIAGKDGSSPA